MGKNQIRELADAWVDAASVAFAEGKDEAGKAYVICAAALRREAKKGAEAE